MDQSKVIILPLCRVCEAQASGFHYGAYTCEACKAFFRRGLAKNPSFECLGDGSCEVSYKNRTSCPYCRYHKCLRIGMCKKAIKTGRYSHATRASNIREMKKLKSQPQSETSPSSSSFTTVTNRNSSQADSTGITQDTCSNVDNHSIISSASKTSDFCESNETSESFERSPKTSEDSAISGLEFECRKMDVDGSSSGVVDPWMLYDKSKVELYECVIKKLYTLYREYSCEEGDETEDVLTQQESEYLELFELKKKVFGSMTPMSVEEYFKFYRATGIDIDGRRELLEEILPKMEQGIKQLVVFAKAIPGFKDICLTDQTALITASRFDIFLIGRHHNFKLKQKIYSGCAGEVLHMDDWRMIKGDVIESVVRVLERIQSLRLSEEETTIIAALLIMTTDNCELLDRDIVERHQDFLLECLFYLFSKHHPHDKQRFSKVVNCLMELRTVREENYKSEEQMANIWWGIINFPPLLHSLFTAPLT